MSDTDGFLSAADIRRATFVRHVELHDSLASTNDRAIELAALTDLATPALVAARLQTAGRGRGRNVWWAAEGALTFSLIVDSTEWGLTQRDWPRISLTVADAICDALGEIVPSEALGIKWPNDVMLDGRKVAGILIEAPSFGAAGKDRLIIGVGINVNNSFAEAPQDLRDGSVSVCEVAGSPCEIQQVLLRFLIAIAVKLQALAENHPSLATSWQRRCWLANQSIAVESGNRRIEGVCHGIADDGALLMKTPTRTERCYSGTVRLIAP